MRKPGLPALLNARRKRERNRADAMIAAQVIRPPPAELFGDPTADLARDDRNGCTGYCAVMDEPLGHPLPLFLVVADDNEAGTPNA